jgi:hypothetical protein
VLLERIVRVECERVHSPIATQVDYRRGRGNLKGQVIARRLIAGHDVRYAGDSPVSRIRP